MKCPYCGLAATVTDPIITSLEGKFLFHGACLNADPEYRTYYKAGLRDDS